MFLFNNSHTNQILWEKAKEYLVFKVLKENLINLFTLRHLKYLIHRTWDKHKILKRGGKNTQENYTKKGLNYLDNHDGMITHLESDILECEVKWALGNITRNKFQLAKLEFHILNPLRNFKSFCEGFLGGSDSKESACNAGDLSLISGSGRSPGEGKGYPLQYSGLDNSMDSTGHGIAKHWTWLSWNFNF